MSTIRILTENVASKIAAGEVIERPASIVRELMDNSIDAGAERIVVRIQNGGKTLVRISDNGVGMSRDDLLLCIERHATSKIRDITDLLSIHTLGFRGEALPSIASVSRLEITTRPLDQLVGYRLTMAGGRMKSLDETGSPAGTVVDVGDLFFNLPARRKFLRAKRTETDQVVETFSRISLPFTHIHFQLLDGDRGLLTLSASEDLRNRFSTLLGRDVASAMIETGREAEDLRIRAHLAPPDMARARGDRILVYVNKRNIRDRLITRAILEGYGQRLMKGRYPQIVLFLEVDPARLDVNVHPTKQEIRFQRAPYVYQTLVTVIEQALKKRFLPPLQIVHPEDQLQDFSERDGANLAEPPVTYAVPEPSGSRDLEEVPFHPPGLVREDPQPIGQLRDTYILCQTRVGLLLVDQHAAHERIVYEKLKRSHERAAVESQFFLIPHQLEVSVGDGSVIQGKLEQLHRLGFDVEHFGGTTFLLRSVPAVLVDLDWKNFLQDILPILREEKDLTQGRALDRLLTTMACHGAIRAGKRLTSQEMHALLEELLGTDLPTNCPHGRPIFKEFPFSEIEKMFKRVL